ncbi:hypothetical protein [Nonomuraea helvata]|uniref:LPXTG cell wall anchor domain-containing protein n=1 Tax=Nonomuraea helvata TaxID=37484 RepID=A0ABV5S5S9_9ACTN
MAQAWRRLAQKMSAVGLISTLVLFVGSVLALSSPAQAAVDKTMEITYRCSGGTALTAGDVKATVTVPDAVEPGKTATVKWKFSVMKAAKALTASLQTSSSGGDLTITGGGTPTPLKGTGTGTVPAGGIQAQGDFTPPEMTATLTAPSTAGTVTLMPATASTAAPLQLKVGMDTADCTYSSVTPTTGISIDVKTGAGGGTDTETVEYYCTLTSGGDADYPANVDIKVTMTTPTSASANADASITWTGTIQNTGDPLKAPTGFPTTSPKIFVSIKASGAGVSTTTPPSGEAALTGVTVGSNIATLPSVTIKVKPTTTGTVTLTAGDLAFGSSSTSAAIKCAAPTSGLKTFTFTVGSSSTTPTPTPTPTPTTTSPKPTKTSTHTVTVTPSSKKTTKSKTPKAGADTGGGGEMGPDGRLFILTGTALIAAAAVGGLIMRRRSIRS